MNQVVLIGRIVRDVELKMLEKGSIMNFTLAVDRGYKDKDGNKQTDFIPIVAFNKDKIADYLLKGKMVAVSGSIQIDKYKDKEGKDKTFTKVNAREIKFLDGGKAEAPGKPNFSAMDDELPF